MSCKYSTTTSSGTFTVYNQFLDKCAAKKFCQKKGHILAPIVNDEDKAAITKLLDPYCAIHRGVRYYHIGLDITPCGNTQDRVFTNGVIYDKSVHGHLYIDEYITPKTKCPLAYMHYIWGDNRLVLGTKNNCGPEPMKILCLDQSTATASAIKHNETENFIVSPVQALIAFGGVFIVVGCLALATLKFYRQSKMLKKELNTLNKDFGL